MLEAFAWGLFASSSLLIGAIVARLWPIGQRLLGVIMAFGVGVLMSAVAYELVGQAFEAASDTKVIAAGMLAGAVTFFLGSLLIGRIGGAERKSFEGRQTAGSGGAIVLGTVLDGVPESIILGLTLVHGGQVSLAVLVAVFLSNLPESIAATTGLKTGGWRSVKIYGLWLTVMAISALSSLIGYALFDHAATAVYAFVLSFAGGAILTMLADTMMPEAYKDTGKSVGLVTTLGFWLAFVLTTLK